MRKVIIVCSIFILSSCAQAIEMDYLAMKTVSGMVGAYCALPGSARKMNRMRWNAVLAPNRVEISCNN